MNFSIKKCAINSTVIAFMSLSSLAYSFGSADRHLVLEVGGFVNSQGKAQTININELIGDYFSVTKRHKAQALVGLGYYIDDMTNNNVHMSYGLHAFYLPSTTVKGDVTQELMFTNLSYKYRVSHVPIYFVIKSTIAKPSANYALILDAGIGPNIIMTRGFKEQSLDNITIPEQPFSSYTKSALSGMVGIGIKMNHIFRSAPVECGYRFFYLGRSYLPKNSDQVLNNLSTGNMYANALSCSVSL
ncbi:MAG: hypothetical protein P4M12_04835 [Gammaproteobacteria bacterium]|nr:hypothetical protein [Gammaproteobacteria bacterium]